MHSSRWIFFALAALLFAAAVGFMAYNAGVANGIAHSGKIVAAPPGTAPAPYAYPPYPYYWGWHPFGFGFFLFPLFFFFLFAFVIRGMFWRARFHHHYGYRCGYRPPEEGAPQQQ